MATKHRHRMPEGTFGDDRFGRLAERFARSFGTPQFLLGQTVFVACWLIANAASWGPDWDPYPFILLNLLFSTQAAYAAPLILLAQTREADRDRAEAAGHEQHNDAQVEAHAAAIRHNAELTEHVAQLTTQIVQLLQELEARQARDAPSGETMRADPPAPKPSADAQVGRSGGEDRP